MGFRLPITRDLFELAETEHEYDDVLAAADEVSARYCCYQAWLEQIDERCYTEGTSLDDIDRYRAAMEPILLPPQIEYAKGEWFPLRTWTTRRGQYDRAIERIREALVV